MAHNAARNVKHMKMYKEVTKHNVFMYFGVNIN